MDTKPSGDDPLLSSTPAKDLTCEQLASVLNAAAVVKARIKDVEVEANARLQDRVPIPDWKLVQGPGQRKWKKTPEEMEAFFKTELKLKQDQYAPRSLNSPAQMEKLGLHIKKWERIAAEIENGKGGLVLAPATDPRPNAKPAVDGLFGDLTDRPAEVVLPAGPFGASPFETEVAGIPAGPFAGVAVGEVTVSLEQCFGEVPAPTAPVTTEQLKALARGACRPAAEEPAAPAAPAMDLSFLGL